MANARTPLSWTEIDTENLSKPLAKAYAEMLASKAAFETAMVVALQAKAVVPADKSALFTYRRGLAFAIVDKRSASGGSAKLSI